MLNEMNNNIQFMVEMEEDGCLPFLDVKLHMGEREIKFSVYTKATNRDDYIY